MRFFSILAITIVAGSAAANPFWSRQTSTACLSAKDTTEIVDAYQQLISNYTDAMCTKYCASSLYDFSDSISTFLFQPLGVPTFPTKAAFMSNQNIAPPFPIRVESVGPSDCTKIALIWNASFGSANRTSRGLSILTTTKTSGAWQISGIDVEFNSLTWLQDMGGNYTWSG